MRRCWLSADDNANTIVNTSCGARERSVERRPIPYPCHDVSRFREVKFCVDLRNSSRRVPEDNASRLDPEFLAQEGGCIMPQPIRRPSMFANPLPTVAAEILRQRECLCARIRDSPRVGNGGISIPRHPLRKRLPPIMLSRLHSRLPAPAFFVAHLSDHVDGAEDVCAKIGLQEWQDHVLILRPQVDDALPAVMLCLVLPKVVYTTFGGLQSRTARRRQVG